MKSKSIDSLPDTAAEEIKSLGANIREARKSRKISATRLTEQANITRPTLQKVEAGDPTVAAGVYANVLHSLGLPGLGSVLGDAGKTQVYNRATEERLLAFYEAQQEKPDPAAWRECFGLPVGILAATTKFLSGIDWYGNKVCLDTFAKELVPGIADKETFLALVGKHKIPFYRFAPVLRKRLSYAKDRKTI